MLTAHTVEQPIVDQFRDLSDSHTVNLGGLAVSDRVSNPGPFGPAVEREDSVPGATGLQGWRAVVGRGENRVCVSRSDAESSVVPVCLRVSMVVEGSHGNRGLLPSSTRLRLLN